MTIKYSIPHLVGYHLTDEWTGHEGKWTFGWNGCMTNLPGVTSINPQLHEMKKGVALQAITELERKRQSLQNQLDDINRILSSVDDEGDWIENYREKKDAHQ